MKVAPVSGGPAADLDEDTGLLVQTRPGGGWIGLKGYGHYHETYRKGADGQWRISSKRNVRLRLDPLDAT